MELPDLLNENTALRSTNVELQREVNELNRKLTEREAELHRLSLGRDGKTIIDAWLKAGDWKADPALGHLQAALQAHTETLRQDFATRDALIAEMRDGFAAIRFALSEEGGVSRADEVAANLLAKTPESVGRTVAELQARVDEVKRLHDEDGRALIAKTRENETLRAELERLRVELKGAEYLLSKVNRPAWDSLRARAEAAEAKVAELAENAPAQPPPKQ